MKKRVTILGSTGSIGKSTISLILDNPDKFEVVALTANANAQALAVQAHILKPQYVALADESKIPQLRELLPDTKIISVQEAAEVEADIVIAAIVGIAGLLPAMAAIKKGRVVGLANKESMVCAGKILIDEAKRSGAKIIPIDSEHNAVFQVLNPNQSVEKVTLTASGGPFLNYTAEQLKTVTREQAIAHPKWSMGAKISVDSATMMNKGLELIEAHYLFDLSSDKLDVVIHPQSIIHSLVTYDDGASLAQLSCPDMRVPISYVLSYPERLTNSTKRLDLAEVGSLTFLKPDLEKFPCLRLAMDALDASPAHQIALNAANEVAVEEFLQGNIKFMQISQMVEGVLERDMPQIKTLEDVLALDAEVRASLVKISNKAA